jgi:hypothetical protein
MVLVGGWAKNWPVIRNDVFVLDLNPVSPTDLLSLLRASGLAPASAAAFDAAATQAADNERSITAAEAAESAAGSSVSEGAGAGADTDASAGAGAGTGAGAGAEFEGDVRNDTAAPSDFVAILLKRRAEHLEAAADAVRRAGAEAAAALDALDEPRRAAALSRLSGLARSSLHARSPARTGCVPMRHIGWQPVQRISGDLPRPRYGHSATTVLVSDAAWLDAVEGDEDEGAEEDGDGDGDGDGGGRGNGAGRRGVGKRSFRGSGLSPLKLAATTPSSSSSSSMRPAASPVGGTVAPSFALSRSLLWHMGGASPAALSPSAVASLVSAPESYGLCPPGAHEALLVYGGMFSGGYSNETNEVWLLRGEMRTEAVLEGGEETTSAAEAASSASAPPPSSSPRNLALRRYLSAEWRRVRQHGAHELSGRGYHTTTFVPYRRSIWISGGIARGDSVWELEELNVDSWTSQPIVTNGGAAPCARHGHSLTSIGSRVFVFGGGTGGDILRDGIDLRDFHVLDLDSMRWSQPQLSIRPGAEPTTTSLAWTGRCHTATPVGDKIIIFGGSTRLSNKLAIIDTTSGTYYEPTTLGRPPRRKYNSCAVKVGRRIHIYGGWADGEPLADHIVLDLCPHSEGESLLLAWPGDVACAGDAESERAAAAGLVVAGPRFVTAAERERFLAGTPGDRFEDEDDGEGDEFDDVDEDDEAGDEDDEDDGDGEEDGDDEEDVGEEEAGGVIDARLARRLRREMNNRGNNQAAFIMRALFGGGINLADLQRIAAAARQARAAQRGDADAEAGAEAEAEAGAAGNGGLQRERGVEPGDRDDARGGADRREDVD